MEPAFHGEEGGERWPLAFCKPREGGGDADSRPLRATAGFRRNPAPGVDVAEDGVGGERGSAPGIGEEGGDGWALAGAAMST